MAPRDKEDMALDGLTIKHALIINMAALMAGIISMKTKKQTTR